MVDVNSVLSNYSKLQRTYPDSIVIVKMGDFYECFGETARGVSKALDIVITKRRRGHPDEIDICGFPYHTLDRAVKTLWNILGKAVVVKDGEKIVVHAKLKEEVTKVVETKRADLMYDEEVWRKIGDCLLNCLCQPDDDLPPGGVRFMDEHDDVTCDIDILLKVLQEDLPIDYFGFWESLRKAQILANASEG